MPTSALLKTTQPQDPGERSEKRSERKLPGFERLGFVVVALEGLFVTFVVAGFETVGLRGDEAPRPALSNKINCNCCNNQT